MKTTFTVDDIHKSVISVPPLCRDENLMPDAEQNARLIKYIEEGGVSTFLYGGNANFYNIGLSEYELVLDQLSSAAASDSWIIPSVGPYYGMMMDQAAILSKLKFPTAMVLPTIAVSTPEGVKEAILKFVQKAGIPAVLYIKDAQYVTLEIVTSLVAEGVISWIKYAVVRPDPADDPLLRSLVEHVDPNMIVSGIGEQPAITHWTKFGVKAFTSGCVCVAPGPSQKMLKALQAGDFATAETIREHFNGLESLRNSHGPIPVLHHAVELAGIANTGPALPLMKTLDDSLQSQIGEAARELAAWATEKQRPKAGE